MSEFVSLPERLRNKARELPDQVALQVLRNNNDNEGAEYDRITYAQLVARCLAVGNALAEAGIGPGDRVALFADNSPEWVIGYLGAHFTGAALIPVDAQYGADEVANLVRFATPKGIITDRAHAQTAADALKKALDCAGEKDLVLATGSLFLTAEVREAALGIEPEIYPELSQP